ncbi:DUF3883 domain-containing protein [Terrisporobacter glycolicus]|nr:DUF3883 domain-containing protein [Terrisporobacter glycolicus]
MSLFDEKLSLYMSTELFSEYDILEEKLENLRLEFIDRFPPDQIMTMEIDEYIVGKKNDDNTESFCYWLETKLMELGKIKGGTTADKKFGVYFGSRKNDAERKYRTIPKWDKQLNPYKAFDCIKDEIVELLSVGVKSDYDAIDSNRISPMFKGKILSTYFPEKYLSIFSEDHLRYFMELLPIEYDTTSKYRIIDRQNLLIDFKNANTIMKDWSNIQFTKFLYTMYNPRDGKVNRSKQSAELIEFGYTGKIQKNKNQKQKKLNYEKINKEKTRVGQKGERIVFSYEKRVLREAGKNDLAKKVTIVSLKDDSLGYDVISYDFDGNEKFIEVKSTTSLPNKIDFYITHNELQVAREEEKYLIYLVYNVDSENPKIHVLDKSVLTEEYLEPINYRVQINVE